MAKDNNAQEAPSPHTLWELESFPEYERSLKKYQKKHTNAVAQMIETLKEVQDALNRGTRPELLPAKYVRGERKGILAIDQRGGRAGGKSQTRELRLYIWPAKENTTLYLLKIGEKDHQSNDIKQCSKMVENLKKEIGNG